MIPWLPKQPVFPSVESALREPDGPNGLLAAGGDLSPERLLAAYRRGIFPWSSEGEPLLWWSPDPRMVMFPAELKISRSFAKVLRNRDYQVSLDTSFVRVMQECAAPRKGNPGTWISADMLAAYTRLHMLGYAHCVETWIDGELAGGLYGVALGRVFYGESMFSRVRDASKIALAHLCRYLEMRGFAVIDCQMKTSHLASLGGREIPRREFVGGLARWTAEPATPEEPGRWPVDAAQTLFQQVS